MEYSSGDIYKGDWKGGERHGVGVMQYANGNVFDGTWSKGVPVPVTVQG